MNELTPEEFRELRERNAAAAEGASCLFDGDTDPAHVPDGYDCGGCACHLSAPCDHCLHHLPEEESSFLDMALRVSGRRTR